MKSFKKSITLLFLFMIVGIGNLWAEKTIGNADNTTQYNIAFSDSYSLVKGDVLHYEFTNYSSTTETWHNWLLFITGALENDFVLRPDNWWFSGDNNRDNAGSITATLSAADYDWDNFKNDMNGASVTMDITHNGTTIDVTVVAVNNSRTYTENLSLTLATANAEISVKLSVENAHIVISKEKFTSYLNNGYLNSRFEGVGGGTGDWAFDNNGYSNKTSGTRLFKIKNLYNGDQVKMTYSGSGNITFSSTNIKTTAGEFVSSGGTLTSGTTYNITNDGTLDLSVIRYQESQNTINAIEVTRYPQDTPALSYTGTPYGLLVGETYDLSMSQAPSTATPTFSSSNSSVATIDEKGHIVAVSYGTTTISSYLTVGGTTVGPVTFDLKVRTTTTDKYVFDFTGSGSAQTLETKSVAGQDYSTIDFNNKTYGSKTFNFIDIFALSNNATLTGNKRIFLHTDGIYNYQDNSEPFYILGLHNGDNIIINYDITSGTQKITSSSIINTSAVESGQEYTITADGTLVLSLGKYNRISSIVIYNDHVTPSFTWSDDNLSTKFDTSSGGKHLRYDLSTLNFTEPTAVVTPSTATYTVRSLNTNVAQMSTSVLGDIMFINTGSVNIQGTLKTGGVDYRDTYTVEVWANNANYDEKGNTCYMSETGMLNADRKTVTAIAGITMEFGSAEDATLIVEDPSSNSGKLVAYTINKLNGWRHRYPYDSNNNPSIPTNGSFYKFTALTNGTLSFKGVKNGGANTVVLVDATNLNSPLITISANTWGYCESTTATLTAGHVYYLYGNVPALESNSDTWSAFLLSEFTFNSDFKLLDINNDEVTYGSTLAGATSASDVVTISGVATPEVYVQGYSGDITSATLSVSNSKLQVSGITGSGGAIRIKITDGGTGVRYFTLTVPYGVHTWDLRTVNNGQSKIEIVNKLKTNVANSNLALSGLTRTYKVISKTSSGGWTSLVDPIIAVNGRVQGDNGFYFEKTAGLIFDTRSSGFGAKETKCTYFTVTNNATSDVVYYSNAASIPDSVKNNANYTVSSAISKEISGDNYDLDNETEYRMTYDVTTEADYMMMRGSSTIIFPGVTAGQYIKLYTYRHSDNKGEKYHAKNLIDLDNRGYAVSDTIVYHGVLNGAYTSGRNDCYGAAIFRVPLNYNASNTDVSAMPAITLADDGWARVYKIEVCDVYSTDMVVSLDRGVYPEFIDLTPNSEYASVVIKDGQAVTQRYSGVCTQIRVQNAGTCEFSFEVVDGEVNYSVANSTDRVYNIATVTYIGGKGVLKITQREKVNNFTIDKKETYVAVNTLTSKTYPYTWDFTNHNMFQGSSSTTTNMASLTAGSYGTWTNNNGTYGATLTTQTPFVDSNNVSQNATTTKTLFAHGSELSAGTNTITETSGLGIAGTYTNASVTRTSSNVEHTYNYKMYDNTSGTLAIDGNKLSGAGTITIPNVSAGQYVFVKASAEPTATLGSTALTKIAVNHFGSYAWDALNDVYAYYISEAGDVNLAFSSADVYKIGVTDVFKIIKNSAGKTTESRNVAIDYAESGTFTANALQPYIATTYTDANSDYGTIALVAKNCIPANTGVLLYNQNPAENKSNRQIPLFVPASNVSAESVEGNKLVANVTSATVAGSTSYVYRYVFTNKFSYTYNNTQRTGDYGFYKVNSSGTLAANMAYLQLNKSSDGISYAKQVVLFDFDSSDGETTAIENIGYEKPEDDVKVDVWYSLDGRRINGRPSVKGIYINQGRKVVIK